MWAGGQRRPPGDQRRARHAPGSDRRTAGRLGAPRRRPASRRAARRGRRDPAVGGAGVVGGAGRHRRAGGRRGERPVARTRRRRRCATGRGADRADPAHQSHAANGAADTSVRWIPALVDNAAIDTLAASMPGTVLPVERTSSTRGAPRHHRGRGDDGDRGDDQRRHQRRADRPSGDAAEHRTPPSTSPTPSSPAWTVRRSPSGPRWRRTVEATRSLVTPRSPTRSGRASSCNSTPRTAVVSGSCRSSRRPTTAG